MRNKEIIEEFDKEFGGKTRDGVSLPISADQDIELKEQFIVFLIKALEKKDNEFLSVLDGLKMDFRRKSIQEWQKKNNQNFRDDEYNRAVEEINQKINEIKRDYE